MFIICLVVLQLEHSDEFDGCAAKGEDPDLEDLGECYVKVGVGLIVCC